MKSEEFETKALGLLTRAKGKMVFKFPFYASLALRLKLTVDWACPTAYTDGVVIGFNPEFICKLPSLDEVIGLLAHEVSHVAYMHPFRIHRRDHAKWNEAGDHVINNILLQAGLKLPEGGLIDQQYANMSTEHVYEIIPTPPKDKVFIGEVRAYTGQPDKNDEKGEIKKTPSMVTEGELQHMEQEWSINLKQAIEVAKQAGNLPKCLEKMVEELTDSSMPWRDLLRDFMTAPAKDDYTWLPPNRRFIYQDLYLPSCYSERLGPVAFVQDTSGSISQNEKKIFIAEFNALVTDTQPEIVYSMYADTAVQFVDEVDPDDFPVKLRDVDGGGTTFEESFNWLEDKSITPSCLIYMTDGYPNHRCVMYEPPYPVLWVCTTQAKDFASFGKVIYFTPD